MTWKRRRCLCHNSELGGTLRSFGAPQGGDHAALRVSHQKNGAAAGNLGPKLGSGVANRDLIAGGERGPYVRHVAEDEADSRQSFSPLPPKGLVRAKTGTHLGLQAFRRAPDGVVL